MFSLRNVNIVDLGKIHGTGDFPCPGCTTILSPDDIEEKSYKILSVDFEEEETKEILIECNTCHRRICITGFESNAISHLENVIFE